MTMKAQTFSCATDQKFYAYLQIITIPAIITTAINAQAINMTTPIPKFCKLRKQKKDHETSESSSEFDAIYFWILLIVLNLSQGFHALHQCSSFIICHVQASRMS